jgi:tetratricopeptide (TPR) repeat protein
MKKNNQFQKIKAEDRVTPTTKKPEVKATPNYLHIALLIFTGILIYSNSFICTFHFDDQPNILENTIIRHLSVTEIWNFSHNRFLPFLSLAINYHFGAYDVWGYHLVNIIIHLTTTSIIYWLTLLIFSTPTLQQHPIATYRRQIAFCTALLFVTHPLATQSVTYIVQRMAAMVALFYLLSVALYIKGRLSKTITKKMIWFGASAIAGLAAIHSKENAYTLPIALLLTEFTLIQTKQISFRINDYRIWIGLGLIATSVLIAITRFSTVIFKPIPPSFGTPYAINSKDYLLTQISVIVKYIQLLFLPVGLNLDYNYPLSTGFFEPRTFICFLLLSSILICAIWQFYRNRLLSFCLLWFFITLTIESSIVPIADLIFEHRTYLPSFGFFLLITTTLFRYAAKIQPLTALTLCVIIAGIYGVATYQRNKIWTDEFTLWSDVIEKSPEKARPLVSRADIYREQGSLNEAIADYEASLSYNPNYALALNNLGLVYKNLGQWDKAIQYYSRSIKIDSSDINGFVNRGVAYGFVQKYDSALNDLNHALAMRQKINVTFNNRGIIYSMMGNNESALVNFDSAIAISPNYSAAFKNRGCVLLSMNQLDKAIIDLNKAIEINSDFAEAYFYRGVTYGLKQDFNNALKDYNKTLSIDPGYKNAIINRNLILQQLNQKP